MFSNPTARTPIMLALGFALAVCVGAADAQQPSANAVAAAKELITVKGAAAIVGGGGGGRPTMARAGGKDPEKLPDALAEAERLILAAL